MSAVTIHPPPAGQGPAKKTKSAGYKKLVVSRGEVLATVANLYFQMYQHAAGQTPPGVPEECTVAGAAAYFQKLAVKVGNFAGGDTHEKDLLKALVAQMYSLSHGRLQFGLHISEDGSEEWN